MHPTPAAYTDVTFTNVKEIATNIQASIAQFSKLMEGLGDTENKQAENYNVYSLTPITIAGPKRKQKMLQTESAKSAEKSSK